MGTSSWQPASVRIRTSDAYRCLLESGGDAIRLPLPAAAWIGQLLAQDARRRLLVLVPREADALAWVEAASLFVPEEESIYFPAPSLSPYQEAEPSLMVRAQEAVALDRVVAGAPATVVCTPRALFRRLPPAKAFASAVRLVEPDQEIELAALVRHLLTYGYVRRDLVSEVGELAVRGGVLDLYPPGVPGPVRLVLFGDTVESVRRFDPITQRSEERLDSLRILPLALFDEGEGSARRLARLIGELEAPTATPGGAEKARQLLGTGAFPGWQNYLPLLADETSSLAELAADALWIAVSPSALGDEIRHHGELLSQEFESRLGHRHLAFPPEALERPADEVLAAAEQARIRIRSLGVGALDAVDFAATTTDSFQGQLPRFPGEVATAVARGDGVHIVVAPERRRQLQELLEDRAGGARFIDGELQRGFRLPAAGVAIYSEHQLFGQLAPAVRKPKARFGPFIAGLRDLRVGDFVVHADHGIGRFVALRTLGAEADTTASLPPSLQPSSAPTSIGVEVMEIAYRGGKTLLLPLTRLDQVQKFSGIEGMAPRLDSLGGTSWNRTKSRVRNSLRQMAEGLLKLYAERKLARAPAMPEDSDLVHQFEAAFEFEETPDQLEAISTIKEDLSKVQPMDRLLCGDVGYGKTEVAMRAAFKAVDGGFQVAVLAPTTILADQHLETFQRRFAGFPIAIDMISRFRSPAQVREITQRIGEGKLDILIGTHRLLNDKIQFANLGLLIVDEEQRFGVVQKERLKRLKKNVHVLAMSATPVPRTLQLSLAGVRDLSVIETPPKDRMAVETAILPFTTELVREAIEFELERGGQVYFVHNRVESIEEMQIFLKETIPSARITVGHGQLDEQELSRRMHAFTAHEFDVLLATTIIENGIDIPNVNTMIVHRADRFGLAQLYQLRGRVGRSNQLAYCYLLVPRDRVLSEDARKRLAAIREFSDLGAGFRIAARDLEIRGAGNLLGAEQSGHIAAVGIETYLKMLEDAVRELRGEVVVEAPSTAIDLPVPLSIPEEYVSDANLRMEIYRKIAAAEEGQDELLAELEDRFGRAPASVHTLLEVAAVKRRAESLRVQSISSQKGKLVLRLRHDARVDVERLIAYVSEHPGATFSPTGVLTLPAAGGSGVLEQTSGILAALGQSAVEVPETA
ncbi:MAG: transcription-repair coupling factor [Acidobacteria bacterium]|nr:transcription-repair coupling factor [Acidobacteriota bacterium]